MTLIARKYVFVLFAVCFSGVGLIFGPAAMGAGAPRAVVDQTTFAFSPVIAGTEVTHQFTIRNTGDAVLNIPGVYSG